MTHQPITRCSIPARESFGKSLRYGLFARLVRGSALCGVMVFCVSLTGCVITRDSAVSSLDFPEAPAVAEGDVTAKATAVAYEVPGETQTEEASTGASQGGVVQAAGSVPPWVAMPADNGCLPACRPHAGLPDGAANRSADPNCFPPGQQQQSQSRPQEANCAGCNKVQQSLSQQAEEIEVRLNARIEQLENQLQESIAQTEELRTLLMKSSQVTVNLQNEVNECKGTIAQMQEDFNRQQREDLKALESLSNSLKNVLTAEVEPDSSEATR